MMQPPSGVCCTAFSSSASSARASSALSALTSNLSCAANSVRMVESAGRAACRRSCANSARENAVRRKAFAPVSSLDSSSICRTLPSIRCACC